MVPRRLSQNAEALYMLQLFFKWAPEIAAAVLPQRRFNPEVGQIPTSIIAVPPALYGFLGCTCLPAYQAVVTIDPQGEN